MNIALIYGGKTGEHEVSLISAASVARHIKNHTVYLIGIAKNGLWYLQQNSELERIKSDFKAVFSIQTDSAKNPLVSIIPGAGKNALCVHGKNITIDVVFPVLHGTFGEDGTIQGLFEMAGIPYVGAGVSASAVCMDKEKTKQIWQQNNLPVVPWVSIKNLHHTTEFDFSQPLNRDCFLQKIKQIETDFGYPVFVKPCNTGSSVGSSKAGNQAELWASIQEAFLWDEKIIVEPFIPAREIECSVTGNMFTKAYTVGEIIPSHEFYDYDAKYTDPNGAVLQIPANLPLAIQEKIQSTAQKAYEVVDCSGFARVDFFIDKRNQNVYLNEINTIPGFTSISMFPKMCEASGLEYENLIRLLLDLAIERFEARSKIKTSR